VQKLARHSQIWPGVTPPSHPPAQQISDSQHRGAALEGFSGGVASLAGGLSSQTDHSGPAWNKLANSWEQLGGKLGEQPDNRWEQHGNSLEQVRDSSDHFRTTWVGAGGEGTVSISPGNEVQDLS
jgi:hypothetical protein